MPPYAKLGEETMEPKSQKVLVHRVDPNYAKRMGYRQKGYAKPPSQI